jgi:hypothetical protein
MLLVTSLCRKGLLKTTKPIKSNAKPGANAVIDIVT